MLHELDHQSTYNEIKPSAFSNDILHSMFISSCNSKTKDKNKDKLYIIAYVHCPAEEPQIAIRKCPTKRDFHNSNEDAGYLIIDLKFVPT